MKHPVPRSRSWIIAIAVLAVLAVAGVGLRVRARSAAAARLPSLPDVTGQPPAVVEHLRRADLLARRRPTSADVVGALGMAYHADLFYAPAAAAYRVAVDLAPDDSRWAYYLALLHLERGEGEPAAARLRSIVAARPDVALAWLRLGDAEFKRARYQEADRAYARAVLAPADGAIAADAPAARRGRVPIAAYAALGRARVALQQGQVDLARQALEPVGAEASQFGAAHRLLADIYHRLGREHDASVQLARAAALPAYNVPPDGMVDALARESRSRVLLLKQASAADLVRDGPWREYLIRRALEFDGRNPDVVYEMGALLQQLKRPEEALAYFNRHLDMVSDDLQTLVQIGKCYVDLGRFADAEAVLRRAVSGADDAVGFYNLGYVLEQRGGAAEAEHLYERALELNPGLAGAHTNLGAALARQGRFAEAFSHFTEAVRLEPGNPAAYNNLGGLFLQQRQFAVASRHFRSALELNPQHADAHANLGAALAQQGLFDEAIREFDETLRIDPSHAAARANRQAVLTRVQVQDRP
jgi:tetratricopeptide (TPR) repeat protein